MSEKHTCPRRSELGQRNEPDQDRWSSGHGLIGQRRGCSYCGSMHPDDFIDAIKAGCEVGPTDKSYKAYLHKALSVEEVAVARARDIAELAKMMTHAEAAETVDAVWDDKVRSGEMLGKFYYQHLSEGQKDEFLELLRSGEMHVGYPGHFYVLPFFLTRVKPLQ